MNHKPPANDEFEALLASFEEQIEVPSDAEERFVRALPGLFADAQARRKLGEVLEDIEGEIDVPADLEARAVARIMNVTVIPPSRPRPSQSVPPKSVDRPSKRWMDDEDHPSTEIKSRG